MRAARSLSLPRFERPTRVVVLVVVPGKELLARTPRILDGAEAIRVSGPVLHGLEVRFRKRVFVGNVRAAVRLDHDASVPNAPQHLAWTTRSGMRSRF